ncbi:hypothetical protein BDZ94DRAFT_1252703 [Collybia nuda]|uniref:Uncharacterized protein n=1 Tax=Collybia nuda TaxID=64659 RepID=A0A9P6CH91_9AGAR|nr:hypothetical protein BDZ94DRAFT_1252703 [Collybia nuda]
MIFVRGHPLIVTTRGPGKLHLLTHGNPNLPSCNGSTETKNAGTTRFLISFSHNYTKFAFHWDGAGEAVYGVGSDLTRVPVGRSWSQASLVNWGASTVTTGDVTSALQHALARNEETTCFIIPDLI